MSSFVAHIGSEEQTVREHCLKTALLSSKYAATIKAEKIGMLQGILHDAGKLTAKFQEYIRGESKKRRGEIDHSYAGAKYVCELAGKNQDVALLIAHTILSHHGLHDWLDRDDEDYCTSRVQKTEDYQEVQVNIGELISEKDADEYAKAACEEWIDVRSFGQVFAFKGEDVSVGVRGPVSVQIAESVSPVEVVSMQITKSVNSESKKGKSSDTMGTKHRVSFGMYVINGSINCQLAEKTGFTAEDAEKIKKALCTLFENDSSSARPEGSMEVCRLYWWEHDSKTPKCSSAEVFRSINIKLKDGVETPKTYKDYEITLEKIDGIEPEIIELV